jgi:hypothetical protein
MLAELAAASRYVAEGFSGGFLVFSDGWIFLL